jgi:hypothetical protein
MIVDISVLGQLAQLQLPFGDALEPGFPEGSTPQHTAQGSAARAGASAAQILQLQGTANTNSSDGMLSFVAGPVQDGPIIPHNPIYAWSA